MIRPCLGERWTAVRGEGGERGLTLIELLVATAIGVVLLGAVSSLMVSALKGQPRITKKAADIGTARWVLNRMTSELRNGITINEATASSVSFQAYVRRTSCGGSTVPAATAPSIKCQVTLRCTTSPKACTRREAPAGQVGQGTAVTTFTGLSNGSAVFTYLPNATTPTYVKVTLTLPDPTGGGDSLTISDGATLRNAVLES
jgi:prepilin-type N-terminal cleavage/methylation domain-containing protein